MNRKASPRRQVFVFTAEEKRAGACVLAAILLGLATMHYRAIHPQAAKLTPKEEYAAKRSSRATNARARSAREQTRFAAAKTNPLPNESEDED